MNAPLQTPPADPALTPSTTNVTPATEPKPSASVSLLNEEEPATDPKTTETKPTEPPKDGDKPASGAPEKYSDFKLPEGLELSPEVVTEVSGLFKEMNLSQTQAQKLVDFHSKTLSETAAAVSKTNMVGWLAQNLAWKPEIKPTPRSVGSLVKSRPGSVP